MKKQQGYLPCNDFLSWIKRNSLVTSSGQRKKILSPHKESNLRPSCLVLSCSTTEPQRLYGKQGLLQSWYITGVLHTAGISNVKSVMICQ